ncbi:MAG: hypothetical protein JO044_19045 [Mycobacteriaceae bacterium]|nr:hypothetical protein [Mycobacteriaceae bacterium]
MSGSTIPNGNGIPDFMPPAVADEPAASARVVAEHTFLPLNESMMRLEEAGPARLEAAVFGCPVRTEQIS